MNFPGSRNNYNNILNNSKDISKKNSMKVINNNSHDNLTLKDLPDNALNQTSYILNIKPNPKLVINNFEYNKTYAEKVAIKNLMAFPIVIKLRSSDVKKMDFGNSANSTNKVVKIAANQTTSVEIKIRIDKKSNSDNYAGVDKRISLFVLLSCELCDVKYFVDLIPAAAVKLDVDDVGDFNVDNSKIHGDDNEILNGIDNSVNNDRDDENFEIVNKNDIYEENKQLKVKVENLVHKLKEFEGLIHSYASLAAVSYNNNTCEDSVTNNFYIDFRENFTIHPTLNDVNDSPNNGISERLLQSHFYLNEHELPLEEKLGLNFNYSKRGGNSDLNINNSIAKAMLNSHSLKTIHLSGNNINFANINSNDKHFGAQTPGFINSEFIDIDYENKINIDIRGDNLNSILLKHEKINIYKIDYDEIENEIIDSIKERFIELELRNYQENQSRVEIFMQVLNTIQTLISDSNKYALRDSNNAETTHNTHIDKDLKQIYRRPFLNSTIISARQDFNFEKNCTKFEKLIKKLKKTLDPILCISTPINILEKEILKKITTVTQDPILSNEELEIIYKEMQNINLLSNELNNYKIENKKLSLEKALLENEFMKISPQLEEYKLITKNLEEDLDLFKRELTQRDDITKTKELLIEELEKELQYMRENYLHPDNLQRGDDCEGKENRDLFALLSEKDDQMLILKSKLMIQDDIIKSLTLNK